MVNQCRRVLGCSITKYAVVVGAQELQIGCHGIHTATLALVRLQCQRRKTPQHLCTQGLLRIIVRWAYLMVRMEQTTAG